MFKVETGDIVCNFYRNTIYYYDKENIEHRRDIFRCRFATLEEIEKFTALSKPQAKLKEIGREQGRWSNKSEVRTELILSDTDIAKIYEYAKNNNLKTEIQVFRKLLNSQNPVIQSPELKQKESEIKEKESKISAFINAFKELNKYIKTIFS